MDPFTKKRVIRFVEEFRKRTGLLPTLHDFEQDHFSEDLVKEAMKEKLLEQFYITLTNGSIVKTYKVRV